MAEIETDVTLDVPRSKIEFTNCDGIGTLTLKNIIITQAAACVITWLINNGPTLEIFMQTKA